MGHKTNSDIYNHYHSAISTVSVQELFREVALANSQQMYGLSVNRIENIPTTVPENGWLEIKQDPEVLEHQGVVEQINQDLREDYGSIAAAIRAFDRRIKDLVAATGLLKTVSGTLSRATFGGSSGTNMSSLVAGITCYF
jgi:hypothetical protein